MSSNQQLLLGVSGGGGGSELFETPGVYCWVVPAGVTSVSIVSVSGGTAGGGALSFKNNISVVPGNSYQVNVGAGSRYNGGNGGYSYVTICGTQWASAQGAASTGTYPSGYYNADGGGKGGGAVQNEPGGGSGAGGYGAVGSNSTGGCGGKGGDGYPGAGQAGVGGAAGGGRRGNNVNGTCWFLQSGGGGGGGVGVYGQGSTGGGTGNASYLYCQSLPYFNGGGYGGAAGSGGAYGSTGGTAYKTSLCATPVIGKAGNGGKYGGGGGKYGAGGYPYVYCSSNGNGCGGDGVVRILWPGCARSFPSCNVGNP